MAKTISVIVPVYNVRDYLGQCVESLTAQTYEALEIILIDDGSTDSSGALCDALAERDGRIRVIHQKNGGAANAKNAGLRAATGTYLAFADSDDFVEPDAYAFMVTRLEESGADVICCGYRNVFTDGTTDCGVDSGDFTAEEFLLRFTADWTCGLLWNKLYRRVVFDGVFFEEGHRIDDEFFTYRGIMHASRIVSEPKIVYNYRRRRSSVMASPASREQIALDKLDYLCSRRRNVVTCFPALKGAYDDQYANVLLLLLRDASATEESIRRAQRQIRQFLAERPAPRLRLRLRLMLRRRQYTPARALLRRRAQEPPNPNLERYFD